MLWLILKRCIPVLGGDTVGIFGQCAGLISIYMCQNVPRIAWCLVLSQFNLLPGANSSKATISRHGCDSVGLDSRAAAAIILLTRGDVRTNSGSSLPGDRNSQSNGPELVSTRSTMLIASNLCGALAVGSHQRVHGALHHLESGRG